MQGSTTHDSTGDSTSRSVRSCGYPFFLDFRWRAQPAQLGPRSKPCLQQAPLFIERRGAVLESGLNGMPDGLPFTKRVENLKLFSGDPAVVDGQVHPMHGKMGALTFQPDHPPCQVLMFLF